MINKAIQYISSSYTFINTLREVFQKPRYIALALVSVLPLGGAEFGIASIMLIGMSTCWIAKKIQAPEMCAIKTGTQHNL